MTNKDIDTISGVETTGHEWDGIKELNNPLPRWWLWTFYGTIVFAIGYTIAFPAWPMISSATSGVLGYSSRAQLAQQMDQVAQSKAAFVDQIKTASLDQIVADPELARFAQAGGRSAFKVYCTQCHGAGAEGARGYPNLNDDEWIWGGSIDQIYTTITHGVRSETDPDTHYNIMPTFSDGILSRDQIVTVSKYVASLSGIKGGEATDEGHQLFLDNCAACHGDQGQGMPELGAPSLNDAVWLYGGTLDDIEAQVTKPHHGVMPAWGSKLGDTTVKQLAVYVHSLGGGM